MSEEKNGLPANKQESGTWQRATEHLKPTQFRKGQSGNPSGRPKSLIGKALLKRLKENNQEQLRAVVEGILGAATKGDAKAFSAIFDRIDGRPTQPIEADINMNISASDAVSRVRERLNDHEG